MPWMNPINEIIDAIGVVLQPVDVKNIVSEEFDPQMQEDLPLLSYYVAGDVNRQPEEQAMPIARRRALTVNVDICRAIDESKELTRWLYERAFEVEVAFDNSDYLGVSTENSLAIKEVERVIWTETRPMDIQVSGEVSIRLLRMVYTINYITELTQTAQLDEFLRANVRYDIDGDPSRYEAGDNIIIREE